MHSQAGEPGYSSNSILKAQERTRKADGVSANLSASPKHKKTMSHLKHSNAEKACSLTQPFCSFQTLNGLDEDHPHCYKDCLFYKHFLNACYCARHF